MSWTLGSEYKQQDTYITFREYTIDGTAQSPAFILCFSVCAAWTLAVVKVVGEISDQAKAAWHLADPQCTIMAIAVVDTGFVLEALPFRRFVFFALMCCVQLVIACALLVAGLRWLGSTTDIVEVLLNGVALAYIMDIDELAYHVLVPDQGGFVDQAPGTHTREVDHDAAREKHVPFHSSVSRLDGRHL